MIEKILGRWVDFDKKRSGLEMMGFFAITLAALVVGFIVLVIIVGVAIESDSEAVLSEAQQTETTIQPKITQESFEVTVDSLRTMLHRAEIEGVMMNGSVEGARGVLTVNWPDFSLYSESDRKDVLNTFISYIITRHGGNIHEVLVFNAANRKVGIAENTLFSGIQIELF